VNDELEAKREKIARERARRPRKVQSRPPSATNPDIEQSQNATEKTGDLQETSNDLADHETEESNDAPSVKQGVAAANAGNCVDQEDSQDIEALPLAQQKRALHRKRMSIQLPVDRTLDKQCLNDINTNWQ